MSVKLRLSALLQKVTNWQETVEVTGGTTMECLEDLEARYPDMRQWTRDKEGEILPQLQFFVNGERIYDNELTNPLKDGDEVFVVIAILGG